MSFVEPPWCPPRTPWKLHGVRYVNCVYHGGYMWWKPCRLHGVQHVFGGHYIASMLSIEDMVDTMWPPWWTSKGDMQTGSINANILCQSWVFKPLSSFFLVNTSLKECIRSIGILKCIMASLTWDLSSSDKNHGKGCNLSPKELRLFLSSECSFIFVVFLGWCLVAFGRFVEYSL